jgi:hypothetical protein
MGTPIVNGGQGPILKPVHVSFDPVKGATYHLHWESAGSGVTGLMSALMNSGIAFDAEVGAAHSSLTAAITAGTNGFPDTVQDHWQLMANEVQKDIKEHPATVAMELASTGSLGLVLAAVDAFNSGTTTAPTFPGAADPIATALFNYMKHGGTHYSLGQYVLKWTTTVSFSSTAYRNEGARELLYSTSQVLAESAPPFRISTAMASIASPTTVSGYYWSWRRVPSTQTTQAGNRIEIATEYWLDQWSTFVYGVA